MNCPRCGAPIRTGRRFCGSCGTALADTGPEQAASPAPIASVEERKPRGIRLWIASSCGVVGLAGLLLLLHYRTGIELDIISTPGGAEVQLDHQPIGRTDATTGSLKIAGVRGGKHELALTHIRRAPTSEKISVGIFDFSKTVRLTLPRKPKGSGVTVERLKQMLAVGTTDAALARAVRRAGVAFPVTPQTIASLQRAGAGSGLLAILNSRDLVRQDVVGDGDIPESARKALDDNLPDWEPDRTYAVDLVDCAPPQTEFRYWFVWGDFDGDGQRDYAALVVHGREVSLMAFLARGAGFQPFLIERRAAWSLLSVARKGTSIPDLKNGAERQLANDALVGVACGKGALAYVYAGSGFERVYVSD